MTAAPEPDTAAVSDEPSPRLWSAFQEAQEDCWRAHTGHRGGMGECCEKEGLAAALAIAVHDHQRAAIAAVRDAADIAHTVLTKAAAARLDGERWITLDQADAVALANAILGNP